MVHAVPHAVCTLCQNIPLGDLVGRVGPQQIYDLYPFRSKMTKKMAHNDLKMVGKNAENGLE